MKKTYKQILIENLTAHINAHYNDDGTVCTSIKGVFFEDSTAGYIDRFEEAHPCIKQEYENQ